MAPTIEDTRPQYHLPRLCCCCFCDCCCCPRVRLTAGLQGTIITAIVTGFTTVDWSGVWAVLHDLVDWPAVWETMQWLVALLVVAGLVLLGWKELKALCQCVR